MALNGYCDKGGGDLAAVIGPEYGFLDLDGFVVTQRLGNRMVLPGRHGTVEILLENGFETGAQ